MKVAVPTKSERHNDEQQHANRTDLTTGEGSKL
jgi:hypothetical protein